MSNEQPAVSAMRAEGMIPAFDSSQAEERKRTLSFIIIIVFCAAIILGTFDIQFRTWPSVGAAYLLGLFCIPTLILNRRGSYILAGSLLSLIVLLTLTVNLYNGDGVRDPGLMTYPIFITVGALLFGKRAAPYFAMAASLSLIGIVAAEVLGWVHPKVGPTEFSILIPIVTQLAVAAGIVWIIVRNLERHMQRAISSEAELRNNYDLTLEAWAKVMEYRDRETEGHSRRLVDLGTRLARALGISEEDVSQLQRGALLHDIGKLAIPDEILLKPSALNEQELKAMQKHPEYAKQMLAGIPFLEPAVAVAYSHHERWDGQGYPQGLSAEQIPFLARLFAVVDAWDALSSERVYRAAWPEEQIKAHLRENAGTKFDPHIVEVFLQLV